MTQYWILKSEPETWSWTDQCAVDSEPWDGVRNHQAANFMRQMKACDQAFFYHSGKERALAGVVEVVREFYPDPEDASGKFGLVDVKAIRPVGQPVTLPQIKADERFADLLLVRQPRLSVIPVSEDQWHWLCELSCTAV